MIDTVLQENEENVLKRKVFFYCNIQNTINYKYRQPILKKFLAIKQ